MTNNNDTKSNITRDISQDNDSISLPPPPPYEREEGGASSKTNSSRAIFYGGATEQTYLLSNNNITSYNYLSKQPIIKKIQKNVYLPTPNLSYTLPGGYYQQPETFAYRTTTTPLENLSTMPAITTCPHCNNIVLSYIEYKTGSCTWLSCFIISNMLVAACFIPFCVNDLKDVVHYCSICNKTMAIYSRLNDRAYDYSYT